jgi:AhpD family alkylhydroperoxidase
MSARIDYTKALNAVPELVAAMTNMEKAMQESGLEKSLIHLIKLRASQINGCAFCVHMHSREARAHGESEERLHLLTTWWESNYFTERERAALAWTDALTRVAETRAPDDVYAQLKAQFDDAEILKVSFCITTINAWNRLAVGMRFQHPKSWKAAA